MRHGLLLLVVVAGCARERPWDVPWPRDPAAYTPPSAPAAVQEGRYPIDLPTVLRLAGANSLDIAFVREKIHEAYARWELAEERFWPSLGPAYVFRRHEGLTQGTDGVFVEVDKQQAFVGGGARLRWEVGDALFGTLAAAQRYGAAKSALEATEQDVLLQAAVAYYDLAREHLRARVSEFSAGISRKLAGELEVAVAAGRGFRGDALRARVQEASSRLNLMRSREAIQLASIRLGSILRLAPGIELYPAEEVPAPLRLVDPGVRQEDLLREAWEKRPEVQEAQADLRAAQRDRSGATWGTLLPEVQAEAVGGGLGPVPSDRDSTEDYAVTLGWRIGPGGLLDRGRERLAEARVRQAEIQLERLRQKVTDQVRSALAQLRAKEEQLQLAEGAVREAQEALRLNQERQAQNIGLPLEVLQAEEALTRTRLDHYTAMVEYNQAQLRAFTAAGRRHAR